MEEDEHDEDNEYEEPEDESEEEEDDEPEGEEDKAENPRVGIRDEVEERHKEKREALITEFQKIGDSQEVAAVRRTIACFLLTEKT